MRHRRWPAVAWTALILIAVAIPGSAVPGPVWNVDKLAHFILFGGFSWFWLRAFPSRWMTIGGIGLAYAVLTEVGQTLSGGARTGDPLDVAANLAGLAAGLLGAALANRRHHAPTRDARNGRGP